LANFLGSILASKEHSSLIISGLQLVELLLVKVPDVSHYLFRREGVLHEVEQLASAELLAPPPPKDSASVIARSTATEVAAEQDNAGPDLASVASPTRPSGLTRALIANDARHDPSQLAENQMKDLVTLRARFVRDRYGSSSAGSAQQATKDLKGIKELAKQLVMLSDVALEDGKPGRLATCLKHIAQLFVKPTKSISSFEMLESGLVDALLKFLLSCKGSSRE
jgi:E3 ubiquitin-protein ligase TRIP12